jgi:hypothetical protein
MRLHMTAVDLRRDIGYGPGKPQPLLPRVYGARRLIRVVGGLPISYDLVNTVTGSDGTEHHCLVQPREWDFRSYLSEGHASVVALFR